MVKKKKGLSLQDTSKPILNSLPLRCEKYVWQQQNVDFELFL